MAMPSPAPGWYPDPSDPAKRIYWDGRAWSAPAPAGTSSSGRKAAVSIGVCLLVVIGFIMSMQSVSLMTGSALIWTGAAVVAAGTAVSFFLRAPVWVRVIAILVLALSLVNAFYIEHQMSVKRNELSHVFDR